MRLMWGCIGSVLHKYTFTYVLCVYVCVCVRLRVYTYTHTHTFRLPACCAPRVHQSGENFSRRLLAGPHLFNADILNKR